jgi:rhodanese-related sulfurtransferase/DNA-binding transcriptional ArsR family regulator
MLLMTFPRSQVRAELFQEFAHVGKALAHPTRLELLDCLVQGERTVESLAAAVGAGLTTCSAHLQVLKQSRLVATRRDGPRVHYRLAGDDVAALLAGVQRVAAAHSAEARTARVSYLGPDDTDAVGRDELLTRAAAGEVTVLDVRSPVEYAAGHIPGAVCIPLDELEQRLHELPAGAEVVAYCRGEFCVLSHDAVRLLTRHGYRARRLVDGILEWRAAGLPLVPDGGAASGRPA